LKASPLTGRLRLGTQGFAFDDWVGPFYPPGTAKGDYLARYADHFHTVEIDSTFYGTPRPAVVRGWHDRTPAEVDLAVLNKALRRTIRGGRLVRSDERFVWEWDVDEEALDSLVGPIALSAAGLLTSLAYKRVGQCEDDRGCGWLFLDTSKNHSRRWCDMNDCGNRAKQRRHYARTRNLRGEGIAPSLRVITPGSD